MLKIGTFSIVLIFYFSIEGSVSVIKLENQSIGHGSRTDSDDDHPSGELLSTKFTFDLIQWFYLNDK